MGTDPENEAAETLATKLVDKALKALKQGRVEDAQKHLERAKKLQIEILDLHYVQALCFIQTGQVSEGLRELRTEVGQFPDNHDAQQLLNEIVAQNQQMLQAQPRHQSVKLVADPKVRAIAYIRSDVVSRCLVSIETLSLIRKKFPAAQITVVCDERSRLAYKNCPDAYEIITYNRKQFLADADYRYRICEAVSSIKADLLINPVSLDDNVGEYLVKASETPTRIGYERELLGEDFKPIQRQAIFSQQIPFRAHFVHELLNSADLLKTLNIENYDKLEPRVWTSVDDESWAKTAVASTQLRERTPIVLWIGNEKDACSYPNFGAALIKSGLTEHYSFIGVGTDDHYEQTENVLRSLDAPILNLCGLLDFGKLAALFKRCKLGIGTELPYVDIAVAAGLKHVLILGGGSFGLNYPYSPLTHSVCLPLACFGCDWVCKFKRAHCVKDISPQLLSSVLQQAITQTSTQPIITAQSSVNPSPAELLPVKFIHSNLQAKNPEGLKHIEWSK